MSIRREPTYLSKEVWWACWMIAKTKVSENGNIMTADEMADTLLREVIEERFPKLVKYQKRIAKVEANLLKILKMND